MPNFGSHQGNRGQYLLPAPASNRFSTAASLRAQVNRSLAALRKRWWVLLLSFVLVAALAVYYAMSKPPSYRSEVTMWVTTKLNMPNTPYNGEDLTTYITTQAELIKTPEIQSRAYEKALAKFPELAHAKRTSAPPHLPFDLAVHASPKSLVVDLRAIGPSAEATQFFLSSVLDEYTAFKNEFRHKSSSGALSRISGQISDVQKQMQQQETQTTQFEVSNNISYLTERGLTAGSHLAKLDEILSDLRTEAHLLELMTPAEFGSLSKGSGASASGTIVPGEKASRELAVNTAPQDTAYYQALQQVDVLKAQRDEFSQVLRPTHSKMIQLNREIAGLEQLLKTLKDDGEQRALGQMVNRKKSLELQIQNLESQYQTWETNAVESRQKLAEYDRMKQDSQRSQALYNRLLELLQTVDLNTELDQELLVPMGPPSPAIPAFSRKGVMMVGILLAGLVATGVFLGLECLDDRFTSAIELGSNIPIEVVGQIPETRLASRNGARAAIAAEALPAFAESFRNLRSFLLFMSPDQTHKPKVILVTSAIPKEGKTTVASNLARTLAMSGARTLLIDADVRRSSIHQIFDVRLQPGLLEVLNRQASLTQAVVGTVQPNLFILPAGNSWDSNSDSLLSSGVDVLLRELATQYTYIVIDSAPVLATDEATSLGPHTDGVLMVVRASYTSARMTREALERLGKRQIKVLGTIYNYAPSSADYYSQYSHDYHHNAREKRTHLIIEPAAARPLNAEANGEG